MTSALDVSGFVSRAREAVALPAAETAMRSLLQAQATSLRAQGCRWVNHVEDEFLVLASPALSIYHITLTPGVSYPPHDHRMPAMIGLYDGVETNCTYRRSGAGLELVQTRDYRAPCVEALPADTIHSVLNPGTVRSAAIHVYFGDLTSMKRSVWDSALCQERPFDNTFYFQQARQS
jgi:predicted metal-dependent enzyme (double-stranded beta helix superfamily)